MNSTLDIVHAAIMKATKLMANQANKHQWAIITGLYIWLSTEQLYLPVGLSCNLALNFVGWYKVV